MSHIGKKPIEIPEEVEVEIEGQKIKVKGPEGEAERKVREEIGVEKKDGFLVFKIKEKTKSSKALFGTERAVTANLVRGVKEKFEKTLRLKGVGYRARIEGNTLVLQVGFSHEVEIKPPSALEIDVQGKKIKVSGVRKDKVNQVASKIRQTRPPNPYTGKGIRYEGEQIKLKPGKKAIGTEA